MVSMIITKNDFIEIQEVDGVAYLIVKKQGYPLFELNKLLINFPRISIEKFNKIKEALLLGTDSPLEMGRLKPLVDCTLSKDKMTAKIKLNCTQKELEEDVHTITSRILEQLYEAGVIEGIDHKILQSGLIPLKEVIIAKGIEVINGNDAIITYFKKSKRKPTIKEDGKADFFELNFIDEVKKGDWLGEKIHATEGQPGKTITGELILPKKGKDHKLVYDAKTVKEYIEGNKIVLRALVDGVIETKGGKIGVGNHLIIEGDVGIETGNVHFNGSITVQGIVQDGYSVIGEKDVSILGELGVSGVKKIESIKGDIFVKGGVFGKGESLIKAAGNVYIRHANECIIEAGGDIHIGCYSIGSMLKANNIYTDEKKGKLIGGTIEAKGKIVAAIIGNQMERKTIIQVEGFDRELLKTKLEELLLIYRENVLEIENIKRQLEIFESFSKELNDAQQLEYDSTKLSFEEKLAIIAQCEEQRKSYTQLLETKGEGEICIQQMAFPETMIKIKKNQKRLVNSTKGTFYAVKNELHFE